VIGQVRRQEASSFEHFVMHASIAPLCPLPCANTLLVNAEKSATQNNNFMDCSLASTDRKTSVLKRKPYGNHRKN